MPWWGQPDPSPCGGAARGSSTTAARLAIRHSPAVLAGGTGLVGSEVCKRPASSAKVRAEGHQASSNASSGGVSLTAVCDLTSGRFVEQQFDEPAGLAPLQEPAWQQERQHRVSLCSGCGAEGVQTAATGLLSTVHTEANI